MKEPLFVSTSNRNNGGRLTTKTISTMCKEGLRAIGLDAREYTAHSLRHTTAVMLLKNGTIQDVQSVLRHQSPTTSQIYTKSVEEELRLAKEAEEAEEEDDDEDIEEDEESSEESDESDGKEEE